MSTPSLRVLWAAKDGNQPEQYEDAYAYTGLNPTSDANESAPLWTVAVADGASSALFAREWAHLLVEAFKTDFPSDKEAEITIEMLGAEWRSQVEARATSWYAQERLPSGSSATLLVVTGNPQTQVWTACSVGDVCVFQVRGDKLHRAFPVERARDFSDRPDLLSTEGSKAAFPKVLRGEGTYQSGDRFLFATDALSAYLLAEVEAGRKPWNEFPQSESEFGAYLKKRRDSGRMKNDDVTLVELVV